MSGANWVGGKRSTAKIRLKDARPRAHFGKQRLVNRTLTQRSDVSISLAHANDNDLPSLKASFTPAANSFKVDSSSKPGPARSSSSSSPNSNRSMKRKSILLEALDAYDSNAYTNKRRRLLEAPDFLCLPLPGPQSHRRPFSLSELDSYTEATIDDIVEDDSDLTVYSKFSDKMRTPPVSSPTLSTGRMADPRNSTNYRTPSPITHLFAHAQGEPDFAYERSSSSGVGSSVSNRQFRFATNEPQTRFSPDRSALISNSPALRDCELLYSPGQSTAQLSATKQIERQDPMHTGERIEHRGGIQEIWDAFMEEMLFAAKESLSTASFIGTSPSIPTAGASSPLAGLPKHAGADFRLHVLDLIQKSSSPSFSSTYRVISDNNDLPGVQRMDELETRGRFDLPECDVRQLSVTQSPGITQDFINEGHSRFAHCTIEHEPPNSEYIVPSQDQPYLARMETMLRPLPDEILLSTPGVPRISSDSQGRTKSSLLPHGSISKGRNSLPFSGQARWSDTRGQPFHTRASVPVERDSQFPRHSPSSTGYSRAVPLSFKEQVSSSDHSILLSENVHINFLDRCAPLKSRGRSEVSLANKVDGNGTNQSSASRVDELDQDMLLKEQMDFAEVNSGDVLVKEGELNLGWDTDRPMESTQEPTWRGIKDDDSRQYQHEIDRSPRRYGRPLNDPPPDTYDNNDIASDTTGEPQEARSRLVENNGTSEKNITAYSTDMECGGFVNPSNIGAHTLPSMLASNLSSSPQAPRKPTMLVLPDLWNPAITSSMVMLNGVILGPDIFGYANDGFDELDDIED